MSVYTLIVLALLAVREGSAIWCYRCTSATPGCAEKFNWRGIGFLGEQCTESNDIQKCSAIWCYRCTSATPGCAEKFNWRGIGFLGEQCPESNDICVKVIEKRGAQETITRDCLSALSFRTDIPADKYEGCRPAAQDVRLAHYVNHTVKEHDVKRDYFSDVTFCFCFLDHRCNGAETSVTSSIALLVSGSIVLLLARKLMSEMNSMS